MMGTPTAVIGRIDEQCSMRAMVLGTKDAEK
jgi:hypothetical protein